MNRIDEIKVEADSFCDQNYPGASEAEYNQLWEYKFAELIMAECISACATNRLGKTASAEELIKQRFGVLE